MQHTSKVRPIAKRVMTAAATVVNLSLCGLMGSFVSCSDDLTGNQLLSACPAPATEHPFAIDGVWRVKLVSTTGQCPAELELQAPMSDGDFRFVQGQSSLQIDPIGSTGPSISMGLVQNGYCHRRQFAHLSCELGGSATLSVNATKDAMLSFEYRLAYERNDHPLCPAEQLPMSCTVAYTYLGLRMRP